MKSWFLEVMLGFNLGAAVCTPVNAAPQDQHKPLWHANYEEAKECARREGKPLLVVFR